MAVRRCANCMKEYNENHNYCPDCGEETMPILLCKKCSEELQDGETFCPACGTPQTTTIASVQAETLEESKKEALSSTRSVRFGLVIFGLIALLLLAASGWGMTIYNHSLNVELESRLALLNDQIITKDSTIRDLSQEVTFYNRTAAIVPDDGRGIYHRYGCDKLDLSYFWIYNVEAAEQKGYDPCPNCWN